MSMSSALELIRQASKEDRGTRFHALLIMFTKVVGTEGATFGVKREAAPGIDGANVEAVPEGA